MSSSGSDLVAVGNRQGWDTELADPFRMVQQMPKLFRRHPSRDWFVAEDSNGRYALKARNRSKFWLSVRKPGNEERTLHLFQLCPNLSQVPEWSIIEHTAASIQDAVRDGREELDISNLSSAVDLLSQAFHLSNDGLVDPLQEAAFRYAASKAEIEEEVWLSISGPVVIQSEDVVYWNEPGLPRPLHSLDRTIEVCIHKGALYDLRACIVECYPPSEDASALVDALLAGGLTRSDIAALDEFAEKMRASGLRWEAKGVAATLSGADN